ncbi:hypothetical protein LY78DRAFT_468623 [Colletotrichum sublineola]|nr:hypothetical protein LY78DRAFT_468623 [Colletotrichum sublineola]
MKVQISTLGTLLGATFSTTVFILGASIRVFGRWIDPFNAITLTTPYLVPTSRSQSNPAQSSPTNPEIAYILGKARVGIGDATLARSGAYHHNRPLGHPPSRVTFPFLKRATMTMT